MKNRIVTSVIFFMCALFLVGCGNMDKADQGSETVQRSVYIRTKKQAFVAKAYLMITM